ncbi:hypothetical protein [Halalkalibacter krulwichiae]|nr:hypothetical protein [Halalkalibacter krulwichiae]
MITILLFITACSSTTNEEPVSTVEQEVEKAAPTEEERDEFLSSNEYIREYEHTIEEDFDFNYLTIVMDDAFAEKEISEQYEYLVELYETYNEKFSELLPNDGRFLNALEVYYSDKEFPTYRINLKSFTIVAVNVGIDREVGEKASEELHIQLDKLEKEMVLSGKESGLTLKEKESNSKEALNTVLYSTAGDIIREGVNTILTSVPSNSSAKLETSKDSDTSIKGMNGYDWIGLTDNKKFHAISNALYNLDQNGYVIEESEFYFIEALNEFYTDTSTISTPVNEALVSVGLMSGTIYK